jgi:hypothetical protein
VSGRAVLRAKKVAREDPVLGMTVAPYDCAGCAETGLTGDGHIEQERVFYRHSGGAG